MPSSLDAFVAASAVRSVRGFEQLEGFFKDAVGGG
jgi:hypothetical protein